MKTLQIALEHWFESPLVEEYPTTRQNDWITSLEQRRPNFNFCIKGTFNMAEITVDESYEIFCHMVIEEFLMQKNMKSTLSAFRSEWPRPAEVRKLHDVIINSN